MQHFWYSYLLKALYIDIKNTLLSLETGHVKFESVWVSPKKRLPKKSV